MLNKTISVLLLFIATIFILIYGQNLLIPLIFSLLLWFLVRKIKITLDKVRFIKKYIPSWFKSLISALFICLILVLVANTLSSSISTITDSYNKYESNVEAITLKLNKSLHINILEIIKAHLGDFDFGKIIGSVFNSLTYLLSNALLIILYTVFIFLEESHFSSKLKAIFPNVDQYVRITRTIDRIEKSIADYIGLKTLVSLISSALCYVMLLWIGVDSPFFWASLIFMFNFIPTIGTFVGTGFPAIFSLLQFGDFTHFFMVLIFIGGIQFLVGNLLEPKLMGNSLNISTLVTIISLSFWGAIWDITGMFLSVPITVIMVIIFSQFEKTKSIAILLSAKGEV
jgi:predicted PurR-regulated permease PerM